MAVDLGLVGVAGSLDPVLEHSAAGTSEGVCYHSSGDEVVWVDDDGVVRRIIHETLAIAVECAYEMNVGVFGDSRIEP